MQAAAAPASLDLLGWRSSLDRAGRDASIQANAKSNFDRDAARTIQFESNDRILPNRKHWRSLMKFRPLHDRVVVERIEADEKSSGGIIIPDTVKEKPSQGEITAVGPGGRDESGKLIPIDLKVGDRVLFGKWSGTEIKLDGVDYLIMKESDIMGVVEQPVAKKKAA
jgi:chaperonin GroES